MFDPKTRPFLVGMIPTYREGPLAASAIHSIINTCNVAVIFEGPVGDAPNVGEETQLTEFVKNPRVHIKHGSWDSEVEKRNAMLETTRRYPIPTWGVFLDADEVFIGTEYIRDYIWAAAHNVTEGNEPAALPVLITEVDFSVGRIHRIIRLDRLECHLLSMSQMRFFGSDIVPTFPVIPVWKPGEEITHEHRPPMQGEPHIHHRSYYRSPARGDYRLHKLEIEEFEQIAREAGLTGIPAGMMPVLQDPGFIVAKEVEE